MKIELRWLEYYVDVSAFPDRIGSKMRAKEARQKLQYREVVETHYLGEEYPRQEWSDWQDVPVVSGEEVNE